MSGPTPDTVFEALGEPVRRLLVQLAAGGEQTAGALVEGVQRVHPISQPSVSQHLRMLRDAGVFTVRAEGTRRYYALDPAAVQVTRRWLEALLDPLAPLANPLDALETELARGARAARRAGSASQTEAG
ncbi:MAG TPA: metalloregulator ArsR/SmtB family transcription factor [Protaetiibacter sp.]|nr:metalloregulator ArsR/SmtB family transcription factor [Protaetiibacter sp.]